MPSHRVVETSPVPIRQFDVVGSDSTGTARFVRHVALAADAHVAYDASSPLRVLHMGPPLESAGECVANCVGSVTLSVDEQQQIGIFFAELASEYQAAQVSDLRQYVVVPHVDELRREDQTIVCRRFSCAGFVIEAYREAKIDLLATDTMTLPPVSLDTIRAQYPDLAPRLDNRRLRAVLGIAGDGPWSVVLAGYVLNSLDRLDAAIRTTPYRAMAGDEFFPPRRPVQKKKAIGGRTESQLKPNRR